MLIGKFYHSLEEKGRISLPKKFRQVSSDWVVTRGLDGCLFIFEKDKFTNELNKLAERTFTKKANRDLTRLMANEASEIKADKNGRVHLPEYLIKFAGLKKQLVIVGSGSRVEIWDQTAYHQYIDQLEDNAAQIAERIDE